VPPIRATAFPVLALFAGTFASSTVDFALVCLVVFPATLGAHSDDKSSPISPAAARKPAHVKAGHGRFPRDAKCWSPATGYEMTIFLLARASTSKTVNLTRTWHHIVRPGEQLGPDSVECRHLFSIAATF